MKEKDTISVFTYADYRKFLLDSFEKKKKSGKKRLSYRSICSKTGIKSSGHLSLILQGKANISVPLALRFAQFLKLNKRETEFFQYLVLFNQGKNHSDKRLYFEKILSFKESAIRLVDADKYEYYNKWYHAVIRALLEFIPVRDNYEDLAKAVDPPISPEEVRKSIELMTHLDLIRPDTDGWYRPVDTMIDTGATVGSVALTNYALDLLDLGKKAFERFPLDERVFSWVTLGISEQGYQEVLQEIREFRRKMYAIAQKDTAERVFQIHIQAFPVSGKKGKK